MQNTIRQLIDWKTGKIAFENNCNAFGAGITDKIPYAYVGKRYDVSTGLLYFGKRYYDPSLRRWLTQDPSGPIDHSNLYQYVFNNPYRFQDPNGENVLGFLCGVGQIALGGAIMASGAVLEVATFGGYTFALGFHEAAGLSLMTSGCAMAVYNAQDIEIPNISWKNTNPFDGPVDDEVYVGDAEPIYYEDFFPINMEKSGKSKSDGEQNKDFKKPKPKISGKEGAKNAPSWAKGNKPYKHESGKDFAKRLLDEKYGKIKHETGPESEFNRIKKWGDRSFE